MEPLWSPVVATGDNRWQIAGGCALPESEVVWTPHAELKRLSLSARGIVRTGEFTPYANVLLQSGVRF